MTDDKHNAASEVKHLTVQVREGNKNTLTSRETHSGALVQGGRVESTFWAFGEARIHGVFDFTFNFGSNVIVNAFSQVAASITELNSPDRNPFLGNAQMQVLNVVPSDQKVIVTAYINFPRDLDFRINLVIAN